MNNSYFGSTLNGYSPLYNNSFEYSTTPTCYYSPLLQPSCPVHSPQMFYTSASLSSSMNMSPIPYTYYQQQQSQVDSPPVQQQIISLTGADHTPLRRHRCFKKNELQILHQAYIHDPHPSTVVLQQLAAQVKAPIDKVRQWFKNRRHSDKLKKRDVTTARTSTTN